MAREADEVWACKGKRVVHFELKGRKVTDDELAEAILGPTGNLRAPAIRTGRTLIVGFDEGTFARLLKR